MAFALRSQVHLSAKGRNARWMHSTTRRVQVKYFKDPVKSSEKKIEILSGLGKPKHEGILEIPRVWKCGGSRNTLRSGKKYLSREKCFWLAPNKSPENAARSGWNTTVRKDQCNRLKITQISFTIQFRLNFKALAKTKTLQSYLYPTRFFNFPMVFPFA